MTLEEFFQKLMEYRAVAVITILAAPWLTWLVCSVIPGKREEPYVLNANLALAVLSLLLWAGYLIYTTNTGGLQLLVKQADVLLLLAPLYYIIASLWVSARRMPLEQIPAFRVLQGLAVLVGAYLVISWLASRIYMVFFSYLPFSAFLWLLAVLLGIAYMGYLRVTGKQ
jgi:hypothetical protein